MRRALAFAALLGLGACQPQAPDGSPAAEPADAPPPAASEAAQSEGFAEDLDARGTEPFWALRIRPGGLRLERPDHAALTFPNPGPAVSGDSAVWSGEAGDLALAATLRREACSDGMSDKVYPMSAAVALRGEVLKGCAEPAR